VDGCRVGFTSDKDKELWKYGTAGKDNKSELSWKNTSKTIIQNDATGRWPANFLHDGSDEVVGLFPEANSTRANGNPNDPKRGRPGMFGLDDSAGNAHDFRDSGSAARFFYCAKASDRDVLPAEDLPLFGERHDAERNVHPTVKPTALMRYLCRLVTPPGGVVLDPFMGSGSTGKAAVLEGFRFIGIEREAEYVEIARRRVEKAQKDSPTQKTHSPLY